MSHTLYLLIHLLRYINNNDTIEVVAGHYDRNNPLVSATIYLANEILIGEDGHPDRMNMDKVIQKGFRIFPGEVDRYGWVTGCIELSRGIIMFG